MSNDNEVAYELPELSVGDMVRWYSDPHNHQDPAMGWICKRPGLRVATILIWADGAGFVEKPSVRHIHDPFWKESESAPAWAKWGAFDLHPDTAALKELRAFLTKKKIDDCRGNKKPVEA